MGAKMRPGEFRWKDLDEKKSIEAKATVAGLSLGNYVRKKLGLEILSRGGQREGAGRKPRKKSQKRILRKH